MECETCEVTEYFTHKKFECRFVFGTSMLQHTIDGLDSEGHLQE